MSSELQVYEAPDEPTILDQAAALFIEFTEQHGRPPSYSELADLLLRENGEDWMERRTLFNLLRRKRFYEILQEKRREFLELTAAPRLLMAQLAGRMGREAAQELIARLGDEDARRNMTTRDLLEIVRVSSSVVESAERDLRETAPEEVNVNRGTVFNLFTQVSPERAAVIMQELARRQLERQRAQTDSDR